MTNKAFPLLLLSVILVLSGCASTPSDYRDPRDPLEAYNRAITSFNEHFDRDIFKPIAKGYVRVTPAAVNKGITNFFSNIDDVISAANNLLQLKLQRTFSDVGRVAINTTLGLLGFFDVATNFDLEKYGEDFGQTLGYWGVGPGPYFVLPILGPSTIRDTFGLVVDRLYINPLNYLELGDWRYGLAAINAIDLRADLLSTTKVLDEAALDPYEFTRDAYLQKQLNDIYDGNPPEDDFYLLDEEFEDEQIKSDNQQEEEQFLDDETPPTK